MTRHDLDTQARNTLVQLVGDLADLARPIALEHFRAPDLRSTNKDHAGFDPVTEADHAVERALRAHLAQHRPQDAILAEEFGASAISADLTWIIDPIDGTRAFLAGAPCWGVLIALADRDGPFLGVIDQPYIGERFLGGLGHARVTGPRGQYLLQTRGTQALSDAILFSTFPEIGTPAERAAFARVAAQVKLTRYGMDCYAYALLAAGHVDLVIEAGLHAYDIAAPIAVIEAAGGIVTDWQGGRPGASGQVIAAANPVVHAQALEYLAGR
ncbi:MAG: histidinol-phosphatase [Roseinatronobacter sp.]